MKQKHLALAVLSATSFAGYASLTSSLDTVDDDGWCQLLPAGKFKSRDGAPHDTEDGHWHLDGDIAAAMIEATKASSPKVVVDYEHATLRAKQTGEPAPASAWLSSSTDIEWREGKGLYIRPSWTERAKSLIDAKEYAFLSAVFPYDKSGRPLLLRMAAITNDPGLVTLDPVAQLAAEFDLNFYHQNGSINLHGQTEDSLVDELLKKLLAKLGIEVPDGGEPTEEQQNAALTALDDLKTKADDLEGQVATLSANDGVDLKNWVHASAYNGLLEKYATLSAGSNETSIKSLISEGKKAGKVFESEVEYLTKFGEQQGVAALSAMLEKRPAIAALTATQTNSQQTPPEDKDKTGKLSQQELAVLNASGLTQEQYLAAK
ncbi:TPA: phage protease [Vibrio harveyi]